STADGQGRVALRDGVRSIARGHRMVLRPFPHHHCLARLGLLCRVQQSDRTVLDGGQSRCEPLGGSFVQFGPVAGGELGETFGVVTEPGAQFTAGGGLLHPGDTFQRGLRHTAWPQSVHQEEFSFGASFLAYLVVDPFQNNRMDGHTSTLSRFIRPSPPRSFRRPPPTDLGHGEESRRAGSGHPPPAPHRVHVLPPSGPRGRPPCPRRPAPHPHPAWARARAEPPSRFPDENRRSPPVGATGSTSPDDVPVW